MEARSDVLDRMAAVNPLPSGASVNPESADRLYVAILAEARQASRRHPRRRLVAAAVALALAVIAAPALAFSDGVRSFLGWPPVPLAVLEESRLLVSAPVDEDTVARFWRSPSTRGGECFFVTYGPPGPLEHAPEMGGGRCGSAGGQFLPAGAPVTIHTGISKRGGADWVPPVVDGRVDPELDVARVEVRWTGGSKELAYADGYFIGAVEALYEVSAELLPIHFIAYDADGREVHRTELSADWFRLD